MNDDEAFRALRARIPNLTPEQKADLLARLKQQKTMTAVDEARERKRDPGDWLLVGLLKALEDKGILPVNGEMGMRGWRSYKRFKENAPELRRRIERYLPNDRRDRTTLVPLARVVGHCLVRYSENLILRMTAAYEYEQRTRATDDEDDDEAESDEERRERRRLMKESKWSPKNIPDLTGSFVLGQAKNAAEALDLCYPGYRESGLLHMVVRPKR